MAMLNRVLRQVSDGVGVRSRVMAVLSYLGVLCFIPLLFSRDDAFVSFHARQGLVIWGWGVLALFSLGIPGFGWFFRFSGSFVTILSVIGIVSALLQQTWKFPLIGDLADQL
ncbi:Magnetosome protein MmsF [uncultured Gammaproteobacteria bacterium]